MWANYREWLKFWFVAKYGKGESGEVSRLIYKNYLKQNGYEDKLKILESER